MATDNEGARPVPRPLRPLDPSEGPAQAFAAELRKLWHGAGNPTFLKMSRHTGKSRTALSEATGGDHLPTWETVKAFVEYCDGDLRQWRTKWEQVRDEMRRHNSPTSDDGQPSDTDDALESGESDHSPVLVATEDDVAEPASDESPALEPVPSAASRRSRLPYVLTALVAAVVASALTVAGLVLSGGFTGTAHPVPPVSPASATVITVQNKVALGADKLVEDTSPAYLSSAPMAYCASHSCKVAGTDLASRTMLVATCYVPGQEMFNYNLDSPESKTNPDRADSTLWYKASFPDGKSGYISEVYIMAADRGGKGLPRCQEGS